MMMPSIFGGRFFNDYFEPFGGYTTSGMLKTDVQENEQGYLVTMDVPGLNKENVKAELKDGYLTVNVSTNTETEDKQEDGTYIRKERYYGSASRSFYVGEDITQEDIKAKFEDGTLKLNIPKKEPKKAVESKQYIEIEG